MTSATTQRVKDRLACSFIIPGDSYNDFMEIVDRFTFAGTTVRKDVATNMGPVRVLANSESETVVSVVRRTDGVLVLGILATRPVHEAAKRLARLLVEAGASVVPHDVTLAAELGI